MSALRIHRRDEDGYTRPRLIDPYTREEYRPDPLPVRGSGPVEVVRPASSAPAVHTPRPGLLSAEEIHARHVKGGKAVAAINKARREGRA